MSTEPKQAAEEMRDVGCEFCKGSRCSPGRLCSDCGCWVGVDGPSEDFSAMRVQMLEAELVLLRRQVLAWTTDKPGVEGNYWFRIDSEDRGELLHIYVDKDGPYRISAGLRRVPPGEWNSGYWLGLLPEIPK